MDGHPISFGPYRLLAAQRLLLKDDRPVRLGNRAFDILAALVERAGDVVGKEQLIARAWPQTFVEESNLKIQVSALRRADDAAAALVARLSRERLDPEWKLRSCLLDDPISEGDCCGEAAALTQINVGSPPEGRGSRRSVR